MYLDDGLKYMLFYFHHGEMIEFDEFFSNGLVQPPTIGIYCEWELDRMQTKSTMRALDIKILWWRLAFVLRLASYPSFRIHGSSTHVMRFSVYHVSTPHI